jgi:putative oxidoreductase
LAAEKLQRCSRRERHPRQEPITPMSAIVTCRGRGDRGEQETANHERNKMLSSVHTLQPHLLSLLRIVSSLVLFSYGTQKILHFPAAASVPPAGSLPWFAGLLELGLGFLVLIGLQTRIAAFVLSGLMAFAYFIAHAPRGFYPAQNGGVAAILFCFLFLYLVAAGAGPFSVDAMLRRRQAVAA